MSQLKDIDLTYEEVLNRVYNHECQDEKYDRFIDGDSQEEDWGETESDEELPGVANQNVIKDLIDKQNQMEQNILHLHLICYQQR